MGALEDREIWMQFPNRQSNRARKSTRGATRKTHEACTWAMQAAVDVNEFVQQRQLQIDSIREAMARARTRQSWRCSRQRRDATIVDGQGLRVQPLAKAAEQQLGGRRRLPCGRQIN